MAVEIKELVIRAVVDYRQETDIKSTSGTTSSNQEVDQEAIIRACVRQVMEMINRSKKR